ncbi:hypothetical protein [Sphingomonas oryzagri]
MTTLSSPRLARPLSLTNLPALCAAIGASPDFHRLIGPATSGSNGPTVAPDHASDAECGAIIVAIYDLLDGTPLAVHAAEIVGVFLAHATALAGRNARCRGASPPAAH